MPVFLVLPHLPCVNDFALYILAISTFDASLPLVLCFLKHAIAVKLTFAVFFKSSNIFLDIITLDSDNEFFYRSCHYDRK